MLIARQKKQENIAEYLLYMWQVEDLLRACDLDDAKIDALLVARYDAAPLEPGQKEEIRQWYHDLADMMRLEGKREGGHLQINEIILADLADLHQKLLRWGEDAIYTSAFYATLPYIVELRACEGDDKKGELETCFTALYGVLLLRMQHKSVTPETEAAIQQIGKFIGFLAAKYALWKKGELTFADAAL